MPLPAATAFETIRQLGLKLRTGACTCIELAEFFLQRLDTVGREFNAVVTVTRERALAEARQADADLQAGRDRGPLHGIPYGAKDLLATKGIPTSWGAAPLKDQMFEEDATAIIRLREAGAVLAAKVAMVELAGGMGYKQANAALTGPGLNPWHKGAWAGGSSSGSGATVAAGCVPFAIGSETFGSIITPAVYCGVSGLRPTYGRVSRHGAMALTWTMDKLGPLARTGDDCGLVLQALAGPDPADPTCSRRPYQYPPRPLLTPPFKLGILKGTVDKLQPEVKANFLAALEVLKKFASIEEHVELPDLPYSVVASTLINGELAAAFDGLFQSGDVWELTAPEDRVGAHAAQLLSAKDYLNAQRIRVRIQREIDALMARYDALVLPTQPAVAAPLDQVFRDYIAPYSLPNIGGAGNVAGLPAVCIPNGFGERGLPTGMQFVGRAWEENRLLALASAYQTATDWHRRIPPALAPA